MPQDPQPADTDPYAVLRTDLSRQYQEPNLRFLKIKMREYEQLRVEIEQVRRDAVEYRTHLNNDVRHRQRALEHACAVRFCKYGLLQGAANLAPVAVESIGQSLAEGKKATASRKRVTAAGICVQGIQRGCNPSMEAKSSSWLTLPEIPARSTAVIQSPITQAPPRGFEPLS